MGRRIAAWMVLGGLIGPVSAMGCSAVLDFDALQSGAEPETGPDTETPESTDDSDSAEPAACGSADECNDNIECTADRCNTSGVCVHDPNNSLCPGFEVCRTGEGCVDIGRECLTEADCDDGIDCTRDSCTADGKCTVLFADDDLCKDPDNLCLIGATCDEAEGCVGAYEKGCPQDEGASCYNYICTPSTGKCDDWEFRPGADRDDDGYCNADPAFGGDDCDDTSDAVNPGVEEIENNQIDDDCDGLTDESNA